MPWVPSAVFPRGRRGAGLSSPAALVRGQGLAEHRSHEVWLRGHGHLEPLPRSCHHCHLGFSTFLPTREAGRS